MIKIVACIKRKPGMSVEAFQAHWLQRHPAPVLKLPGLRRYVQSHARLAGYRRGELPHDGIAELWFDDTAALKRANAGPEYAAVLEDEARFIDRSSRAFLLVDEHAIVDGPVPAGGVKNIEFVTRRPGMPVDAFQRHWREVHGPLAARIPVLRRYVQNHARASAYRDGRQPLYDGLAITWFDGTDAMRESARTEAYRLTREDEPNFIAPGPIPIVIADEHVILG